MGCFLIELTSSNFLADLNGSGEYSSSFLIKDSVLGTEIISDELATATSGFSIFGDGLGEVVVIIGTTGSIAAVISTFGIGD